MLSIPFIIMSTYDEFQNILSLPNTIHRKVKSESSLEELVVGYNSPVCSRTVMEEELTVHVWTLQGMTTTAVRSTINGYENGCSLGGGTDDKNYLIKFTHRAAVLSYSLIPGFSLRDIRKSPSFFSMSSGFCSVGAKLLLDKLSHVVFIKKWFACNYLIHLCRSCRDDITIMIIIYNSLLNKIWAFRKKYGGTRLLPFRSLF
jgi:hypothetical protein